MNKTNKKISMLALSMVFAVSFGFAVSSVSANAASAVTTEEKTTTYNSETKRVIKVENDSFTLDFTISEGSGNWGFAQFSAFADTAYSIGDTSATVDALDLMVSGTNINVNQNNGWSECNAALVSGQSKGWITGAYEAGISDSITVSKANDNGDIKIVCNAYPDGIVIASTAYKNNKTLTFDQLVDENGYTYFKTCATAAYSLTLTDTWTVVNDVQFENVLDMSKLKLTKAYDENDNELIVADYKITSTGYELICDGAATLEFTDGENTVTVALGENVVFPSKNYLIEDEYKISEITASGTSDRISVGDTQYGMVEVKDDSVKFNFGIYYDATPTSNKTFNICIGPNTYVQTAGENISDANFKAGVFSLFTYITNEGKMACEFYDSGWTQHTGTIEVLKLNAGELNVASVEIKKEAGVWNLYICGKKVESMRNNVAFDFNALIGDTFMNAENKANFAVVGHSGAGIKVSLLGTKVDVLADLSTAYNADFYGEVVGAYDADGNAIAVYDGEVSETGYSFVTLDVSEIKEIELSTIGGVTTRVAADVANKAFANTATIGEDGYDKTLTVLKESGLVANGATVKVMAGDEDVTDYYEIVEENGVFTIKGVNKAITVKVSCTDNGKIAEEEIIFDKETDEKEVTLKFYEYTYTSELVKTLNISDRLFLSGAVDASNGLQFTIQLDTALQASGAQVFILDSEMNDNDFANGGYETFETSANGVRLVVLMSDHKIFLDMHQVTAGESTILSGAYLGSASIHAFDLSADSKLTFSLVGNDLYLGTTLVYTFTSASWLNSDGNSYIGAFVSKGYASSELNASCKVNIYADAITVSDVVFDNITAEMAQGVFFVGFDALDNEYKIAHSAIDVVGQTYTVYGINIGHKIIGIKAYTAGGVVATLNLVSETVTFGVGQTVTITPNVDIAAEDVKVYVENGTKDITEYLSIAVDDGNIVIGGLENIHVDIFLEKTNMETAVVSLDVAEADVSTSAELVWATYSVILEITDGENVIENAQSSITVYDVSDNTTPLVVDITFVNNKYVVSGIRKGLAVEIVFEMGGYMSDRVNATDTQEMKIIVGRIYTATFTIQAGNSYLTDTTALTLMGATADVTFIYDTQLQKFVISGLSTEVRVVVDLLGYETEKIDFSETVTSATVVLTAIDKSALNATITLARAKAGSATVSVDGTDVLPENMWVTEEDKATLNNAIAAAALIANKADATQTEVDNAKTALERAISAFENAKKAGTYVEESGCGSVVMTGFIGAMAAISIVFAMRKRRED